MELEMSFIRPEFIQEYIVMKGGHTIFRNPGLGPRQPDDKPPGPLGTFHQSGGGFRPPGSNPILLSHVIAPMGPTRPRTS